MPIINSQIKTIPAIRIPLRNTSMPLQEQLHYSNMTSAGGEMERSGLEQKHWVSESSHVIKKFKGVPFLTLDLSMGSTGASASSRTRTVFTQPLAAAQSKGVHRVQFLSNKKHSFAHSYETEHFLVLLPCFNVCPCINKRLHNHVVACQGG